MGLHWISVFFFWISVWFYWNEIINQMYLLKVEMRLKKLKCWLAEIKSDRCCQRNCHCTLLWSSRAESHELWWQLVSHLSCTWTDLTFWSVSSQKEKFSLHFISQKTCFVSEAKRGRRPQVPSNSPGSTCIVALNAVCVRSPFTHMNLTCLDSAWLPLSEAFFN